ncbi:MAG: DUF4837 family protein [Cyclobacteriaceae bacterium]|nr:DUF4837 family protein [Cyclobacteriaceae bacterium]
MRYWLLILLLPVFSACGDKGRHIPLATGLVGDLYVVMDSAQRKGTIGRLIDSIFQAEMPGLPREEPMFRIHWVDARRYNYVLKERRNLIFVTTLDRRSDGAAIVRRMFTPESLETIRKKPNDFFSSRSDVNARSQEMAFIYGPDEATLARNLRAKGGQMVSYFNLKERQRQTQGLYKSGQMKGITDILIRDFSCALKVPFGYKLAYQQPDFLWIRQINPRDDKDIFISRKPYTSQEDFSLKNLIAFRDDVCRRNLFADPDDLESYLMTETTVPYIPVTADTVNFNGRFAIQLRGLFRSHTPGVGGPFIGFALVDEGTQQFYYIEGFTISPGRDQREIMRELETILYTFQTSVELKPAAQETPAP